MIPEQDKKELIELADKYREWELPEEFHKVALEALRETHAAQNQLTEKQLLEAFRQAIACGDFLKFIRQGDGAQQIVYLPGEGMERAIKDARKDVLDRAWALCGEILTELKVYDQQFFDRHGGGAAVNYLNPNENEQ